MLLIIFSYLCYCNHVWRNIQVKLFNAGTRQQNDYDKALTSRVLLIQFWHLSQMVAWIITKCIFF